MTFAQAEFDVRCEWGADGVRVLAPVSDAVVIVDVMSFSTAVSVTVARGGTVFPYGSRDASAAAFADSIGAELAGSRREGGYSLSPASLMNLPEGTRLVLPSPNGSELSLLAGSARAFAGCLRNARAVAKAASSCGRRIAVIPAGERWREDGSLRPALEDLIGAGAVIDHLEGTLSPEAAAALAVYQAAAPRLAEVLMTCGSGKQLVAMGFEADIPLIAELDADDVAPMLRDGAYRRIKT